MVLVRFAVAVSAIALSTASAQAQQTTNQSDVSQTGTDNILVIDNARAGNDQNRSSLIQNGTSNRATVIQIGDFNESLIRQIGDRNITNHTEEGDFNRAETVQTGDDHGSAIRQRGLSNSAVVEQQGTRLRSQIAQGSGASATEDFTFAQFYDPNVAATRSGNDNRVSVSQIGTDLNSTVRQRAAANSSASADNNNGRIIQRGNGNLSTLTQESRGNVAEVFQFQGGNTTTLRNQTTVTQGNSAATSASNPLSNNRASASVAGQSNSGTINQNGRNSNAELSQGLGQGLTQRGSGVSNLVRVSQAGNTNSVTVAQDSVAAVGDVWQQAGSPEGRSSNNSVDLQQGTGTTGSDSFSAGFFGNTAPTGAATRNLTADVIQGNNPNSASFNVAQVRQDGVDLTAIVRQAGTGTSALPNLVRISQQGGTGGANRATGVQGAGVGPSAAGDPAAGQAGDEFFFGGGARSAELNILQSGSANSATIEQRGRGQFARIEQGPGTGNTASILQDVAATNATAVISQTGSNNTYDVVQTGPGQYIRVRQTGNNNVVTDVVRRP
jgi:hypothetical protein